MEFHIWTFDIDLSGKELSYPVSRDLSCPFGTMGGSQLYNSHTACVRRTKTAQLCQALVLGSHCKAQP